MTSSQGWRDIHRGRPSTGRRVARMAIFAFLLACIAWFIVELIAPFQHPNSHFVYAVASDDPELGEVATPYMLRQFANLTPLRTSLARSAESPADIPLIPWSPSAIESFGRRIETAVGSAGTANGAATGEDAAGIAAGDSVLIYLNAHQSDFATDEAVTQWVTQVRRLPGSLKIVFLDLATPLLPDPSILLPDATVHRIASIVKQTGDPTLWVMTSHSALQLSHLSPALRRTVFGYFVARGLKGDADLDQDRLIETDELTVYLRVSVGDWVDHASNSGATQTPQMIWGGSEQDDDASKQVDWPSMPILPVSKIPFEDREQDVQASLSEAEQPRERGKWENLLRNRAANRMLPIVNPIRDKLTEARVPEITAELNNADSGGNPEKGKADPKDKAAQGDKATQGDKAGQATGGDGTGGDGTGGGAAGNGTGDDGEGAEDAGDAVALVEPLEDDDLVERLGKAWLIHDQLLDRSEQKIRPLDYAPDLWWQYRQTLLTVDRAIRSGLRLETRTLSRLLDEQLLPMAVLVTGIAAGPVAAADAGQPLSPDALASRFKKRRSATDSPSMIGSLALLRMSGLLGSRFDPEQLAAIALFEAALAEKKPTAMLQWMKESWQPDFELVSELRLAHQLKSLVGSDWPIYRRAIEMRSLGEQTSVGVASSPALVKEMLEADRIRRQAEQTLFDRLGEDWSMQAEQLYKAAEPIYLRLLENSELRDELQQLVNDLLADLPYHLALNRCGGGESTHPWPTDSQIELALSLLLRWSAGDADSAPTQTSVSASIRSLVEQVRAIHTELQQPYAPETSERMLQGNVSPSDAWYMSMVLRTPLLPVQSRMKWIAVLPAVEAAGLRDYTPPDHEAIAQSRMPAVPWQDENDAAVRLAALRSRAAAWCTWQDRWLAIVPLHGDSAEASQTMANVVSRSLIGRLRKWPETPDAASDFLSGYVQVRSALTADQQRVWPSELGRILEGSIDLSQPDQRPQLRKRLKDVEIAIRVLNPTRDGVLDSGLVYERLVSSRRYDQFRWQSRREQAAIEEAVSFDRQRQVDLITNYDRMAAAELLQPAVNPPQRSLIEIETTDSVSFSPAQESVTMNVTVRNRGGEALPVWLLVRTDDRFLDVQSSNDSNVYQEDALRDELNWLVRDADDKLQSLISTRADAKAEREAQDQRLNQLRQAAIYPYRPAAADLPPTFQLRPGETRTVSLILHRKHQLSDSTKLIVRALTQTDHARSDIPVGLPDRAAVDLIVEGQADTWTQDGGVVTLLPYPNRETPYRLLLTNRRGSDLAATASVYALASPIGSVPETMLTLEAADRFLETLGRPTAVLDSHPVLLPGDGSPVEILPNPPPILSDGKEVPISLSVSASGPAEGKAEQPTGPASISLKDGILIVVRDPDTRSAVLKLVRMSPQRPRRYVRPAVGYDASIGKLTINVDAKEDIAIADEGTPSGGIPVEVRLSDDASQPMSMKLNGLITNQARQLRLQADIAPNDQTRIMIEIDVDGFPRAFLYRFHPTGSIPSIDEWRGRDRIKITAPQAGKSFAAPVASIEVAASVDAPVGSFLDPRDRLEIGIDADQDREFRDDFPMIFQSDRQVDLTWTPPPAAKKAAAMSIATRVTDFEFELPSGTITNARVNLLGHLQVGGEEIWSEPVEIVLDGQPPTLGVTRIRPSRSILVDKPFEVSVAGEDGNLTEIASVQIGFAKPGTTTFTDAPPPVPATLTPGGVWNATVPTSGLPAGQHRMLIQATDSVGNVSRPKAVAIELRSAEDMEAEAKQPKPILGQVVHGKTLADGATVELFSTEDQPRLIATRSADREGRFEFARVAPGTYSLKSRAVVRNNAYTGEESITVPEGNQKLAPVVIEIQMTPRPQ